MGRAAGLAGMMVRQAANVVELLEYFSSIRRPASLSQIADALEWPRSSTFNLINTLLAKGYLYEPKSRGGFYPSLRWLRVAEVIAAAEPLPEAAQRAAQEVADATGETACIAAPAGISALLVYAVQSRKPIRFSPWLGERNPIQASASGRALLSQYAPTERQALYRKITFERYTPNTLATAAEVEEVVTAGAARGFHISAAEVEEDLVAVATALPSNGRTLALVVAGPMFRCHERIDEFGRLLCAVTRSSRAPGQPDADAALGTVDI